MSAIVVALALAHLGLALVLRDTFPADQQIGRFVQLTPGGSFFSAIADMLAMRAVQVPILALCGVVALRAKQYPLAITIGLVLVALWLNYPIKQLVGRERPVEGQMAVRVDAPGYAFPSGHTSSAVLVYGTLILVAWCEVRHLSTRWALTIAAAMAIALIAWQRPYLGAHWPSDVVGAVFISGALLAVSVAIPRYIWDRRTQTSIARTHHP